MIPSHSSNIKARFHSDRTSRRYCHYRYPGRYAATSLIKGENEGSRDFMLSNNKQLVLGWTMYSVDYDDRCANNFTIPGTEAGDYFWKIQ
jgi:hypothetical protein